MGDALTEAKLSQPIGPEDALLVIDMQNDFVPCSDSNPHGGKFGAPPPTRAERVARARSHRVAPTCQSRCNRRWHSQTAVNLAVACSSDGCQMASFGISTCPSHGPSARSPGVPEGDAISGPICELIAHFMQRGATVGATRDYHPHDHASFLGQGGPFPAHCVQGSEGSKFRPKVARALSAAMAAAGQVGTNPATLGRTQPRS